MFQVRLKELRESAGLSQAKLAKNLNIAQSTVGMWENGKNKPEHATLIKLSEYFNVSVDYLIGIEDEKETPPASAKSVSDDDIKFALFKGSEGITDAMYEEVCAFADFVKQKYRNEKKGDE